MTETVMSVTDFAWNIEVRNTLQRAILVSIDHFGAARLGGCLKDQAAAIAQVFHLSEKAVLENILLMLNNEDLVVRNGMVIIA